MMVSVATLLLLVTGWGSALAANMSSVFVTNTASNPMPVQQQGTASVEVTNTSVPVHDTNVDSNGNLMRGVLPQPRVLKPPHFFIATLASRRLATASTGSW